MQHRQWTMMQTMNDDADGNAATQTMGNNADNDNAPRCRRGGNATTSRIGVLVALVRARAVVAALETALAVVAARLVVVAVTVMVTVVAARLVAVDLYVSGRMLLEKTICKARLTSLRRWHRNREFNIIVCFSSLVDTVNVIAKPEGESDAMR
jgi:hypothetical protein